MLTLSLTPISMVRSLKMIPSIPDMEASFPEMSDYSRSDTFYLSRDVLFEFHLKFWNTASIGIPVRSLLKGRQTSNWSNCSMKRNDCSMVFK